MFGRDEEVQQTLQRIAGVTLLNEPEQLTEDCGSRYLERREQGGEGTLNGRIQGLRILEDKEKARFNGVTSYGVHKTSLNTCLHIC